MICFTYLIYVTDTLLLLLLIYVYLVSLNLASNWHTCHLWVGGISMKRAGFKVQECHLWWNVGRYVLSLSLTHTHSCCCDLHPIDARTNLHGMDLRKGLSGIVLHLYYLFSVTRILHAKVKRTWNNGTWHVGGDENDLHHKLMNRGKIILLLEKNVG